MYNRLALPEKSANVPGVNQLWGVALERLVKTKDKGLLYFLELGLFSGA